MMEKLETWKRHLKKLCRTPGRDKKMKKRYGRRKDEVYKSPLVSEEEKKENERDAYLKK